MSHTESYITLAALTLILATPVFSQQSTPAAAAPPAGPSPVLSATAFETPPVFRASEILTPEQLSGPYHKVREEVATNGATNTYTIDSDFGVFVVNGDHMIPVRVREIYAIAAIRKTKDSDAYGKALKNAAQGTVDGAKALVTDPKKALSGMGKGAMRFMKGASERVRTMSDEGDTAADLKKYSGARREIAGNYGVDPYTSNPVLRQEIDDLATAASAGSLTFSLATMAIPGGAGFAVSGISSSSTLNQKLIEEGPYDLRRENRDLLRAMALGDSLIESFLNHPILNPKHQTVITLALSKMNGARARGTLLRLAMAAQSEEDALFLSRGAALMARYHTTRASVLEVVDFHGMPACYTAEKKLVLPILLDYGSWSETGEELTRNFLEFNQEGLAIEGHEWFITGALSPRAKKETAARGLLVTQHVLAAGSE